MPKMTPVAKFDGTLAASFLCLAAAVLNHAIFRLGALPLAWAAAFAVVVVMVTLLAPDVELRNPYAQAGRPQWHQLLLGLVVAGPVLADLLLGWTREFPFSGDHYFHVTQAYRLALWWLSPVGSAVIKLPTIEDVRNVLSHPTSLVTSRAVVLVVIAAATAGIYRLHQRAGALVLATLALIAFGLTEKTIFLRYPGGAYFLGMPFLAPAFLLDNLELIGRLTNVTALLAWLFVLRPLLIGRWPDIRILPAAAFLFWQKEIVYYFDSVYLEPWAFIFALLAVEMLVERGREGAPAACLLVGLASAVKEPLILALPFVWLAGAPWSGSWRAVARLTGAALAGGMPFVLYYAARKNVGVADLGADRIYQFTFSLEGFTKYLAEFGYQMQIAFDGPSAILAIAALAAVPILLWRRFGDPVVLLCLFAAGIGIALFFAFDANTRWFGYFRFFLYSIPFLSCGAIAFGKKLSARGALALGVVVLALQGPSVYTQLARAAGPSTDRNFIEHFDSPIVFPTKSLIAAAERNGFLPKNAPVLANLADAFLRPLPGSRVHYGSTFGELICECNTRHPHILAQFIRYANMGPRPLKTAPSPGDRRWFWDNNRQQREACLATMNRTCTHVLQRHEGGELVGAFGGIPKADAGAARR